MPKDNVIILATYNIRVPCDSPPNDWDSRRDRVRWMINKHHFDIFGVQEAPKKQIDDIIEDTSFAKVGGGRDDFKAAARLGSHLEDGPQGTFAHFPQLGTPHEERADRLHLRLR